MAEESSGGGGRMKSDIYVTVILHAPTAKAPPG